MATLTHRDNGDDTSTVLKPIPASDARHEALRIDGQRVWRDTVIEVRNRYDGAPYSATVIDCVTPDMPLVKYETFGPVSPIMRFRDIDEAIRKSNSTDHALSSVCTNRFDHITRFITELEVGSVNVREVPVYRLELTPFGGVKDSGLGYKEGVQEATKSFTNVKTHSLPR
ncbi:hypothetical protein WS90_12410 [Burkholderia cepacia]|uniref:Aldehyde dehydrogenase domain-containing protein n=1 Tax=Burkholderia cepacia TaxID=292 RepID=A0A103ZPF9_BURCE|nr:hypothetical protein WS90_12410 [Burkholderia cepacia]